MTGDEDVIRYFTQQELRQLFMVSPHGLDVSETQQQLQAMHAHQRKATGELRGTAFVTVS